MREKTETAPRRSYSPGTLPHCVAAEQDFEWPFGLTRAATARFQSNAFVEVKLWQSFLAPATPATESQFLVATKFLLAGPMMLVIEHAKNCVIGLNVIWHCAAPNFETSESFSGYAG